MRMDSKSFPTKVERNIMEGFGRLPLPISYACTIYVCVCVREIIVLWMVIVLTWQGWLSELKIEKEMRMDSKSFPTKVERNFIEGFGRLPLPISYACTIYMCVCVCEREIIVLWMVIVLTWQGRLSELKIEKEMRMDSKSFPTKVGRNLMEGFRRFPFPISYACIMCVCVCVWDYCFMNGRCPHLTGMAFRA